MLFKLQLLNNDCAYLLNTIWYLNTCTIAIKPANWYTYHLKHLSFFAVYHLKTRESVSFITGELIFFLALKYLIS